MEYKFLKVSQVKVVSNQMYSVVLVALPVLSTGLCVLIYCVEHL